MAPQLKYCHACHNEFYDDTICPRCHSDFLEDIEGHSDPSAFYDEAEEDEYPPYEFGGAPLPYVSFPRPNPVQPQQQTQEQRAQSPFVSQQSQAGETRAPPVIDPFGMGSGAQGQAQSSAGSMAGTPRPTVQPGTNPMFMDGYRHILEQLLRGIGQRPGGAQQDPRFINNPNANNNPHFQPHIGPFHQQEAFGPQNQYPQQGQYQPPQQGGFQQQGMFQGPAHVLGGHPQGGPQPVPQPQVPRNTRPWFHYSMTTVGPDGRIHHISNDPESRPPDAVGGGGGRQIPVPTLNDFLGMHGPGGAGGGGGPHAAAGEPGFEDPFGYHPLGMMLRQLMEGMAPIHGERGDYLPYGTTMDDIITQLMEQGPGSTAPPPASNEALDSLPRYKADKSLVDGGKECTVCKDNFSLGEDVVRLPCLHVFHQDCIMPWLKINGSCPVCRYTLNGQSQNSNNNDTPGSPPNSNRSTSPTSPRPPSQLGAGGGLLSSITNLLGSFGGGVNRGSTSGTTGNQVTGAGGQQQHAGRGRSNSLPPEEDLD